MHASTEASNGYHLFTASINVDFLQRNAYHYQRPKGLGHPRCEKYAKTALQVGRLLPLSGDYTDADARIK